MNDRDAAERVLWKRDHLTHDPRNRDDGEWGHWDQCAEAMDLTIEGHRLIAQEIGFEARLTWRAVVQWVRELAGAVARRGTAPPA